MGIIQTLLMIIFVPICFLLIVVILLQSARGGGLAATFGGQATTLFGPRSAASALSKLTQYLAAIFLVISFVLSLIVGAGIRQGSGTQKVLERTPVGALPSVEELNLSGEKASPSAPGGSQTAEQEPFEPGK